MTITDQKIWHIEKPKENRYELTSVLCGLPMRKVSPYLLSVDSIFTNSKNIVICSDCYSLLTKSVKLGKNNQ